MEFEVLGDLGPVDGDEIYRDYEHSLDVVYRTPSIQASYSIDAGFMQIDLDDYGRLMGFWGYLPLGAASMLKIPEFEARGNRIAVDGQTLQVLRPGVSKPISGSEKWCAFHDESRALLMHLDPGRDPHTLQGISTFSTVRGAWILLDGTHAVGTIVRIDPE